MSIDRLNAEDRLMLEADTLWPQDVGALAILDGTELLDPAGSLRIDLVRETVQSRLPLEAVLVRHRRRGGMQRRMSTDLMAISLPPRLSGRPLPAGYRPAKFRDSARKRDDRR